MIRHTPIGPITGHFSLLSSNNQYTLVSEIFKGDDAFFMFHKIRRGVTATPPASKGREATQL